MKQSIIRLDELKGRIENLEIRGDASKNIEEELQENGIIITYNVLCMLKSKGLTTFKNLKLIKVFRLELYKLGLTDFSNFQQIYSAAARCRIEGYRFGFCPVEVGPYYRLKYTNQPLSNQSFIFMKPISDVCGRPCIFGLARDVRGLLLNDVGVGPHLRWNPDDKFLFHLLKLRS